MQQHINQAPPPQVPLPMGKESMCKHVNSILTAHAQKAILVDFGILRTKPSLHHQPLSHSQMASRRQTSEAATKRKTQRWPYQCGGRTNFAEFNHLCMSSIPLNHSSRGTCTTSFRVFTQHFWFSTNFGYVKSLKSLARHNHHHWNRLFRDRSTYPGATAT